MDTTRFEHSHFLQDLPNRQTYVKLEPIDKGLSGDRKFALETADGQRFLLRVSDIEAFARKKAMYDMMERVAALGVPMSKPLGFGVCNGGASVYQLLSWCDGETADMALPAMTAAEQYALGVKTGRALRLIHTLPAPDGLEDWQDRFLRDNDERVRAFLGCGVPIDGSDALFAYYEANRPLLRGRPQCFLHGDFHNENLLISQNHDVSIVDWELLDSLYGDPWLEFNRILSTELIPHFTSGQLYGYFDGDPPAAFWPVLAFYLSAGGSPSK